MTRKNVTPAPITAADRCMTPEDHAIHKRLGQAFESSYRFGDRDDARSFKEHLGAAALKHESKVQRLAAAGRHYNVTKQRHRRAVLKLSHNATAALIGAALALVLGVAACAQHGWRAKLIGLAILAGVALTVLNIGRDLRRHP